MNNAKRSARGRRAPVGLYIHIPFCETKCGYCDFYSVPLQNRPTSPLVDRILIELESRCAAHGETVRTVFCGGGTPTILPAEDLARLLDAIRMCVRPGIEEFTVEANPATVDERTAALLCQGGVTRVSLGAQSFVAGELAALERIHSADDIAPSVESLRRAGIAQVNLDLIFGIPGQHITSWADSLRRAIDLEPEHLACYGLTYEPGTRLTAERRRGRLQPCDEKLESEMYLHMVETLQRAGYEQYEISNFALPGCRCRHNLGYWGNEPYIGVGPSAAGYIEGRRYKNVSDIAAYSRMMNAVGHAEVESECVAGETLMHEMILMQLRLAEGLSVEAFRNRTGTDPLTLFADVLARHRAGGLLTVSPTHIALTTKGRLVTNAIMTDLACTCRPQEEQTPRGRSRSRAGRPHATEPRP